MTTTVQPAVSRTAEPKIRAALLHSVALAVACLVTYELTTQVLSRVHSISASDDLLGGMWAVIATVFVYRTGYQESLTAALSRSAATLLSSCSASGTCWWRPSIRGRWPRLSAWGP